MASHLWTESEIKVLTDMWKNGFSTKEIAHELGRNKVQVKSFVSRKRSELGLEPRTSYNQRLDVEDRKSEYDKWLDRMWKGSVPYLHWSITKPWKVS